MKTLRYLAVAVAAASLAACAGAPVSVCANLPLIRAGEDLAEAMAERDLKPEEQVAKALLRAGMDARCARAAASAPG